MLKINVQDVVKVLTIDESGVCEDGTNRTWVKCSALSFFDEEETYISLFAFGYTADMILENHTGDNMRRAFISGTLEIEEGYEIVKVEFNGVKKSIKLPKPTYKIVADTLRFIDKNNCGETSEADVVVGEEEEVLDLTAGASGKSKSKEIETAASSENKTNTTTTTTRKRQRRERR